MISNVIYLNAQGAKIPKNALLMINIKGLKCVYI